MGSSSQVTGYPHRPYDFGADASVQTVTVFPQNQRAANARAPIGVHLPANVSAKNLTLNIDGRDFTHFAQRHGTSFYWTPDYDLQKGWHTAIFRAMSSTGERLEQNWTFEVR